MTFKVTTTAALAVPNERTYHRFSDLADDVVDARVYMGIHFRFADTAARRRGLASRRRPSITSCGRFTIVVTIMTRSAATTMMATTGIVMVVAATDRSKSESEPVVARAWRKANSCW